MITRVPLEPSDEQYIKTPTLPCSYEDMTEFTRVISWYVLAAIRAAGLEPKEVQFSDEVASEVTVVAVHGEYEVTLIFETAKFVFMSLEKLTDAVKTTYPVKP